MKIYYIILTLLILSGAFYWYELRPVNIRVECKKYVESNRLWEVQPAEREFLGGDINKINAAEREKTNFWYKDCLNGKGLKE